MNSNRCTLAVVAGEWVCLGGKHLDEQLAEGGAAIGGGYEAFDAGAESVEFGGWLRLFGGFRAGGVHEALIGRNGDGL